MLCSCMASVRQVCSGWSDLEHTDWSDLALLLPLWDDGTVSHEGQFLDL